MADTEITGLTTVQLREAVAEKSQRLHGYWAQAQVDAGDNRRYDLMRIKELQGDSKARLEALQAMGRELDAYKVELDQRIEAERLADRAAGLDQASRRPAGGIVHPAGGVERHGIRDLGRLVTATEVFKRGGLGQIPQGTAREIGHFDIDVRDLIRIRNAVFHTGAGWDPEDVRVGRVAFDEQRPAPVVAGFLPAVPTSQSTVLYMEETTFTNSAAETAESTATTAADLLPESALAYTEQSSEVRLIGHFLPVTEQQIEDEPAVSSLVNQRLIFMLLQRLDLQILTGNGTAPNLRGTNNVSGINTQAKGSDPTFDAVYKAMQKVRGGGSTPGFAEPSVGFIHPNDWQDLRLTRTADGIYVLGNPADPGPERLWGMRVVQTTAATENTMTLGDYAMHSNLYNRRGVTVEVTNSHSHYFTRFMLAIRASLRVALVHYRPRAFATVTGI